MERNIELEIISYAKEKRLQRDEGSSILRGVVRDEKKGLFKYYLKMNLTPWPKLFPIVYEEDNLIKRSADNHVYKEGNFCFDTDSRQSFLINSRQITSLVQFHEEVLLPYLARQFDYHNGYTDAFKNNELTHGADGKIEGYKRILKLDGKSNEEVRFLLKKVLLKEKLEARYIDSKLRNIPCFCQSGIKSKLCNHNESIIHKYIDPKFLEEDFWHIFPSLGQVYSSSN